MEMFDFLQILKVILEHFLREIKEWRMFLENKSSTKSFDLVRIEMYMDHD